jgi:hypothetical protein
MVMPSKEPKTNGAAGIDAEGGRRPTAVPAPATAAPELLDRPRRRTFTAQTKLRTRRPCLRLATDPAFSSQPQTQIASSPPYKENWAPFDLSVRSRPCADGQWRNASTGLTRHKNTRISMHKPSPGACSPPGAGSRPRGTSHRRLRWLPVEVWPDAINLLDRACLGS